MKKMKHNQKKKDRPEKKKKKKKKHIHPTTFNPNIWSDPIMTENLSLKFGWNNKQS